MSAQRGKPCLYLIPRFMLSVVSSSKPDLLLLKVWHLVSKEMAAFSSHTVWLLYDSRRFDFRDWCLLDHSFQHFVCIRHAKKVFIFGKETERCTTPRRFISSAGIWEAFFSGCAAESGAVKVSQRPLLPSALSLLPSKTRFPPSGPLIYTGNMLAFVPKWTNELPLKCMPILPLNSN